MCVCVGVCVCVERERERERFIQRQASTFFVLRALKQRSICLSKADGKSVIHPGMKPLIAVSEHENWIQVDKSICGSDPFTVDLSQ